MRWWGQGMSFALSLTVCWSALWGVMLSGLWCPRLLSEVLHLSRALLCMCKRWLKCVYTFNTGLMDSQAAFRHVLNSDWSPDILQRGCIWEHKSLSQRLRGFSCQRRVKNQDNVHKSSCENTVGDTPEDTLQAGALMTSITQPDKYIDLTVVVVV